MQTKEKAPCPAATRQGKSETIHHAQSTTNLRENQAHKDFFSRICEDQGITMLPLQAGGKNLDLLNMDGESLFSGLAMRLGGRDAIFYDDDAGEWEKRLICAHELGHILFGHLRQGRYKKQSGEYQEQEARIFSAVITALMLYDEYRPSKFVVAQPSEFRTAP